MSTKAMKTTSDIDSKLLFKDDDRVAKTKPATAFTQAISMKAFVDDVKLRYPNEFSAAAQTWVYFYTKEDTYSSQEERTFGRRTTVRHYVTFRPRMIIFASVDAVTKKVTRIAKTKGLDVYCAYGIKFETHIPKHEWDAERKRASAEVKKDSDGNVIFKSEKELKEGCKVNMIRIINQLKTFKREASKWDLTSNEIEYYDWRVDAFKDDTTLVQYMLKYLKPADQFESLELTLDEAAADDDGEVLFDE